ARLRSSALDHGGMRHSSVVSGRVRPLGRVMRTLCPVDCTYGVSTSPDSAVTYSRANGPPPVSRARCSPVRGSSQRGLITQLYLSAKSRLPGAGSVVWFHG